MKIQLLLNPDWGQPLFDIIEHRLHVCQILVGINQHENSKLLEVSLVLLHLVLEVLRDFGVDRLLRLALSSRDRRM